MIRRSYEFSDLRAHLIDNMSQSALVVGTEELGFLVVHFEIHSKYWLPGEDPSPGPVPPFPDGGAGIVAHG